MQKVLGLFFCLLMLAGCQRDYGEFIRYHDDGRMKPRVAFLPVIDHSPQQLPWSVSDELSEGMRDKFMRNGNLFVSSELAAQRGFGSFSTEEWLDGDSEPYGLFAPDHDFVVLLELMDHRQVPYERQKIRPVYPAAGEIGSVLMMTMRVKVVDIRTEEPKVVLHQFMHSNHLVPKKRMDLDYRQIPWKAMTYRETPIGQAHARLERDVVAQVEQYVTYHMH